MATAKKNKSTKKNYANKKTVHEQIVDQLLAYMEKGELPWQKPWTSLPSPQNALTGYKYNPYNQFILSMEMRQRNSDDPRFCTFNQLVSQGWSLKPKSKAVQIYQAFNRLQKVEIKNSGTDNVPEGNEQAEKKYEEKRVRGVTHANLFHASDIVIYPPILNEKGKPVMELRKVIDPYTGETIMKEMPKPDLTKAPQPLPKIDIKTYTHDEVYENAERVIAASGADLYIEKIDKAYFSPARDEIHVPEKEYFKRIEDYYGTIMHELTHWTGHKKRLGRDMSGSFGSESYAREELVAELSSVFLSLSNNVPVNLEQNAAYIQSWMKAIKDNPDYLYSVIRQAEAAHDYLQGKILTIDYIPVTDRLQEACELINDFSGCKPYEKPLGLDALPDKIIMAFKKSVKELDLEDSKIEKVYEALESIKASILGKAHDEPARVEGEQLVNLINKYKTAVTRQKFAKVDPDFIKKDKKHILNYMKKSHGRCLK